MSIKRPRFEDENTLESINISPLIDVIFILLIFFIVTMVFADNSAIKVDVPKASNVESVDNKPITIVINDDNSVNYNGKDFSILSLQSTLKNEMNSETTVILRGDKNAKLNTLVSVMDIVKSCNAKQIFISADKK